MKRHTIIVSATIAVLLFTVFLSLKCGILPTSFRDIWQIFADPDGYPGFILRELRLSRTLLALFSGAALAVSGVILQKVLHNDLASPEILGISGGAGCAGLILLLYFPSMAGMLNIAGFTGALLAASLICLAAWHRTLSPGKLILAGVAMSAVFSTVSGTVILLNSDRLTGVMEFTMGGFAGKTMENFTTALPFFAGAFILCGFLPKRLELLALGKDEAVSLGLAVNRNRLLALATAALAAATAVSAAGLLGFVGLIAPHIAGKLLNSRKSGILLLQSALCGAELTLASDILGRVAAMPRELPCGIFLSAAGAIFFLILLLRERNFDA